MPAKTGAQYISRLSEMSTEVWIRGERIEDVTTHPALRNGVRSVADLYDMQLDPGLQEEMTYASPTDGEPVGLSFLIPRTVEDLERRRAMMTRWAWSSCGMMARTPDFLNVAITAWAGGAEYFGQNRPEFKKNVLDYYEFIRENDITLTHTLVNLQKSRIPGMADNLDEQVALTVMRETDAGIIVKGSRMLATLGPITDEIAVYPTRSHLLGDNAWRQAFSFSIPCDTPGVKFMCRESLDQGRSHFDHPLGSRFEEMDAVVFFDDVLVPWERVFLLGDVDMCNNHGNATQMNTHTGHQVTTRCVVKAEFILGLAGQMVETLGSEQLDHVQERMGELVCYLEILKACVRASEADAKLNEWGVMCPSAAPLVAGRNLFPRMMYPRMAEIIQILGSSSLMALPSEADFDTALTPEVERYLATDNSSARDRTRLFHLAWDVSCSSFSGRQVLYERMFGGNPLRDAMTLFNNYDKEPFRQRVREFLGKDI